MHRLREFNFLLTIDTVDDNVLKVGFLPQKSADMLHLELEVFYCGPLVRTDGPSNLQNAVRDSYICTTYVYPASCELSSSHSLRTYVFGVRHRFTFPKISLESG